MKRVIDGKVYNTETATKLYENSYGYASDFAHYEETLYHTEKGTFFLCGSGGPISSWAEYHSDGTRTGSEGIVPFSWEDALNWCENHGVDADDIMRWFEVEEA